MKRCIFIILFSLALNLSFSQSVNEYKYALVPSKFIFLNEVDQYKLNTLTKLLMGKYGFVAFLDNEVLPDDVLNNNCNKVYVDVVKSSGIFTTKLSIVLKDCKNNILFTTAEGKSREKEFKVAYNEALRDAFASFETLKYKYSPKESLPVLTNTENQKNQLILKNESFQENKEMLFAQPISNGFQLIDASPKVILKIFKTSLPTTFLATREQIQGVLIYKENQWFFEYYQNATLISETINVKF
ncbi:hypothetical protein [Flavobacterium luteum]|uniref:Uncharacterized protein n=1 Tax=Flavobacterium luteum TaxID=2026654 RepID=A0A7J5ADU5_9FLAO|nr:hypothetical protein [Flavobacterium luteum]KAB1155732.1 hypothetical protein F6464_09420 [Flavobacterium luteum]